MMFGTLLQSTLYQNYCTFGGVNTNNWIGICILVSMIMLMIGGAIYGLSELFPAALKERLKGSARVEIFQAVLSVIIVAIIIAFAMSMCSIAQAITSNTSTQVFTGISYNDPIRFALAYMRDLLFTKSLTLFSQIYSETINLVIWGNIFEGIIDTVTVPVAPFVSEALQHDAVGVFFGFSGVLTGAYVTVITITFGILYILYLFVVIIQQTAMTLLVPLSIVMRCLPFMGPRLRETADSFLAIGIAFYYIFPLAIILNTFIIAWLYAPCNLSTATDLCNPYAQYVGSYNLGTIDVTKFFTRQPVSLHMGTFDFSLPYNFIWQGLTGLGGAGNSFTNGLSIMTSLPQLIINYGQLVGEYLFESIVLMGVAILITIGFAQGLSRGLNSVSKILGVSPVWGGGGG
ncbi:MAG: hypothetical protein KGI00_04425 [Candidatus Micrarchaeota archaeon]|nr:hypothetical protein [Candidatus Micrarchaeota archaeon]MDE1824054.1 hypothetical protein [Candidatus Micrarchaeota archaeon]MDE1849945.1 hypothetical protein [Candidatus Micrarchaeota archaeon]